ncbi:MAG: putative ATPase/signal transduction histidine kinase/DNA-binding response OmpR family regulator [Phenylobacterium sp.]|jgi:predicted ATPase/signal transduction histidine kinase/DNA-binding response OmpR family regulator
MKLAGFTVTEVIYSFEDTVVARALSPLEGLDNESVIIKYQNTEYPSVELDAQWKHEFRVLQTIDSPSVVKAKALLHNNNSHILVLEDFSSTSLAWLIQQDTLTFTQRLQIACQLVVALSEVHKHHLIHRDIAPKNVLIDPQTLTIKLCDFALASTLTREQPQIKNTRLWGTLEYMSPELTGRTNLDVDFRSDFYSLGVSLYELFCGRKPFVFDDPMTLLHSHIARLPEPLDLVDNKISIEVSAIVLKLLAKSPDDRYQSSYGLLADLKDCLKQWQTKGQIDHFTVGQSDISERFSISQRIYGRDKQLQDIMAAFDRASVGQAELILVGGYSGIGKSALVNELHKPIVAKRGFFSSGKCDQYNRNQPYVALIQAFGALMSQLLSEGEDRLRYWRGKLQTALGNNAAVIAEIIPDLVRLIGEIPDLPELPPAETEKRFHITFSHFVKALSSSGHPLVIFLDDLQWSDVPTLRLLEQQIISNESNAVLIVGAYRNNEVKQGHPLLTTLQNIELAQGKVKSLFLDNLSPTHVAQLIADSFHCTLSDAQPLMDLCIEKTQGNPFFLNQFLATLYDNGDIRYNRKGGAWQWDTGDIQRQDMTDNVVELMAGKLRKLTPATQKLLSLAAHLGNRFNLHQLSIVYEHDVLKTSEHLWPALHANLVLPLDENYKFNQDVDTISEARYRFLHDRVQQAAYSLVDEKARKPLQLNIGRLLLLHTPAEDLDNQLFNILEPLNNARELITDPAEKARVLALNVRAGIKAKSASAFQASVSMLRIAKASLVEDAWQLHPNQTLTVFKELSEAEYLAGNFDAADLLYAEGINDADDILAKITLILVKSEQYQLQTKFPESVHALITGLNLLNDDQSDSETISAEQLPQLFSDVESMLAQSDTKSLLALDEMTRHEHLMAMQLHANLLSGLYLTGRFQSFGLSACKMVLLTLNHGQSDLSAIGYRSYMVVMAMMKEPYPRCYQMGQLAVELADHRGNKYHRSSVYQYFSGGYQHWCEPLQNAFAYLEQAIKWGQEGINLVYACYSVVLVNILKAIKGVNLAKLEQEITQGLDFMNQSHQNASANYVLFSSLQPILALQGKTPDPLCFDDETVSVNQFFKGDYTTPSMELALYSYAMIRHAYLMNNRCLQQQFIKNLPVVNALMPDSPLMTESTFYTALSLLSFAVPGERAFIDNIIQSKNLASQIKQWANFCPQNYEHKYLIVAAEIARVSGDVNSAMGLYDRAIESAEKAGFIQCEALANELYANFWLNQNQSRVAKTFIKEAHYLYQHWGAIAKCNLIEEQWPKVSFKFAEKTSGSYERTVNDVTSHTMSSSNASQLDIHSLLKANQLLAEEIHIDSLLEKMMMILLENAGAQQGAIVFDQDSQLRVEIIGRHNTLDGGVTHELLNATLAETCAEDPPMLPDSLLRYVQQTQETLLLNDPAEDQRFSHNKYLQRLQPKSVLVLPIIGQGKLVAIVYLENNLTKQAFTPQHLETLELLGSQAAVSLMNAWLYDSLEEKVRKRTEQLNSEKDKADKANETKSLFLANMSHEIRTPLTTVIGFAEGILFDDIEEADHHQAIQTIANSGKHLLLLINDILDFSKIEAGQLLVEMLDVNIIEMLTNLESLTNGMVKSKAIDFTIDLELPLPDVISTDSTRLNQILLNLLSNAVKFTEVGGVTLKVFTLGEQLIFEVSDTGVGIKKESIGALFFAFEQADKTVQRKYGGTGLGLTISKSLAQMLGGDIVAKSELGSGSTFTVTIDLNTVEQTQTINSLEALQDYRSAIVGASNTPVSQLDGNILVAEDQPENLQLIVKILEKMGLSVTGTANGKEAFEAYLTDDFDLILLDIQMPIMDGLETLDMLTSISNSTPVIALTANAMKHEVDEYLRIGFDDHLAKPIERKTFISKISHYLGQSSDFVDVELSANELLELQQQFEANLPQYLDSLAENLRNKDWPALQRDAHSLKGAASTLGYIELSEAAGLLEGKLKADDLAPVEQDVSQLLALADGKLTTQESDLTS